MLEILLRRHGYAPVVASGAHEGQARIASSPPFDLVITDLVMPDGSGMEVLKAALAREEATQVVMMTAFATTEQAVEAMREGAYDYLQKPFRNRELLATIEKALEKRAIVDENRALRAQVHASWSEGDMVGKSDAMCRVRDLVRRVADARTSVLITGESGTGKEIVARAVHEQGDRRGGPFVVVNCGALPENLMESELFGHEKGAFTGADKRKKGLFQQAQAGTIFLDEVGELPLNLQVKLLRVLQERKVRPLGGHEETEVDVRVVAATNRDIDADVEQGLFRSDLFFRLNVIRLHLPPLRERVEDIPLLAEHMLRKHSALQRRRLSINPEVLRWLAHQRFPGNVRELENIVERAVTLTQGSDITMDDVVHTPAPASNATLELPCDLDAHLSEIERGILERAMAEAKGVRTQAAKLLGMSLRSFRYRLSKYGMHDPSGDAERDSAEEP